MALTAGKPKKGEDFEILAAGTYSAVCQSVHDLDRKSVV
jgi:hypothetical protein